jgi:hypothetical protein
MQVKIFKSEWYIGDKMETLEMGRKRNSRVAFFEEPWAVKGKTDITEELLKNDKNGQGLELIRTWDITAVSAIVLLPFGLSLAFAAVWTGVYVAKGTDVQVAVQTAFTVASYIVTAGRYILIPENVSKLMSSL